MAFRRSSVRTRYPPLHKARRDNELRRALFLEFRKEVVCKGICKRLVGWMVGSDSQRRSPPGLRSTNGALSWSA